MNLIERLNFVADVISDESDGEESYSLLMLRAVGEIRGLQSALAESIAAKERAEAELKKAREHSAISVADQAKTSIVLCSMRGDK